MRARRDVGGRLERALIAAAARAGHAIGITGTRSTPWASVTFTGARHRLTIEAVATPGLHAWIAELPEADLPLSGHIVADLAVAALQMDAGRLRAELEALTVEAF